MNPCKKCSLKCLLTHGKRGDLDVVRSFIKVMIHDKFSDVLFIPPRFAPELASLVNKEIRVEDTSGRHWTVTLSYLNGKLAFRRGWNAFVSDHGIKFGDFVIVHYILGANFVVQIFGKSGCDKLQFPSFSHSPRNKRAKTSGSSTDSGLNSTTSEDAGFKVNTVQGNKKRSSKAPMSASSHKKGVKRQFFEDPCCIINRDIAPPPTVDRCFIDLSELEMGKTKPACENGSLSVQGDGLTDHTERENILDFGAFQADMEILNDSQANENLKHGDISGQMLPKSRPSMLDVSATEHKMKHAGVSAGSSQEARANGSLKHGEISGQSLPKDRPFMSTVSATGHKMKHVNVSAGPSLGARASASLKHGEISGQNLPGSRPSMSAVKATEHKTKHADVCAGPSREAQTVSFKAQVAPLRDQGAAKVRDESNPNGFGASASASVRIAKKENKNLYPEDFFERSVKIVKDHKEANPKSFGGSAKIVEKELSLKSAGGIAKIVKKEPIQMSAGGSAKIVKKEPNQKSVGGSGMIKKEFIEDNHPQNFGKRCNANGSLQEGGVSISGPLLKKVKAEVVDLDEPASPPTVTCLVASVDSFLEMPGDFALSIYAEKELLLLRDSAGKLWPVLYHKKTGVKAITDGWLQFRKANRIRLGDQCVFELKDKSENIYQVHVTKP